MKILKDILKDILSFKRDKRYSSIKRSNCFLFGNGSAKKRYERALCGFYAMVISKK